MMSKVEMSLKEYNEIMEELKLYKSTLIGLLTASKEDYYLDRIKEGESYNFYLESDRECLTKAQKEFCKSIVMNNLPDAYKELIESGRAKIEYSSYNDVYAHLGNIIVEAIKVGDEE